MQVTLITAATADGARVSISGVDVSGSGVWRGTAQEAGTAVEVELTIGDEIDWRRVPVGPSAGATVEEGWQDLVVRGLVEDLEDDGVLTLRVGEGMVLIETLGEPPSGIVGRELNLTFHDVEIFPYTW